MNFFDTLIIAGKYQVKPPFPFSPGGEFSGVVESVGPGVTGLAPGDRVMGFTNFGAARERVAVAADKLGKIPADLDFDRAAALTITYGTGYHALKHRAKLKPGETLAVLGASGGTGLAAVELGKLMGARVIACASSDDKLAFARQHGADEAVNYDKEDLRDALKRLGGEHGIDVVYDPVGGRYSEPAVRSLAWQGRHLVVGFAAGEIPEAAAQSGAAQGLRHPRRVLGQLGAARPAELPRRARPARAVVRRRQALVPHPESLSARRAARGAQGARRPQGDGQAGGAALELGLPARPFHNVVPAQARTYIPNACGYGSPLARGRRKEERATQARQTSDAPKPARSSPRRA